MTSATSASGAGSVLGERYELTRHVAAGGTTDVYEGLDRSLRRPVAVKVYRAGGAVDRDRFDAEVATLLEDPAVRVYDAGVWSTDGGYVVVELADEPTLLSKLGEAVDGDAPTRVAALGGDTSVMPRPLQPAPLLSPGGPDRRMLWALIAAIILMATLAVTQSGGGIEVPTPTTEPVQVTSPPPPSTTLPPTTEEPVAERSGKGKGHGRDKSDD